MFFIPWSAPIQAVATCAPAPRAVNLGADHVIHFRHAEPARNAVVVSSAVTADRSTRQQDGVDAMFALADSAALPKLRRVVQAYGRPRALYAPGGESLNQIAGMRQGTYSPHTWWRFWAASSQLQSAQCSPRSLGLSGLVRRIGLGVLLSY